MSLLLLKRIVARSCTVIIVATLCLTASWGVAQTFEEVPFLSDGEPAPLKLSSPGKTQAESAPKLPAVASPPDGLWRQRQLIVDQNAYRYHTQNRSNVQSGSGGSQSQYVAQNQQVSQNQDDDPWESKQRLLPSIRLVQGLIPKTATSEKVVPPAQSGYQGAGRIVPEGSLSSEPETLAPPRRNVPSSVQGLTTPQIPSTTLQSQQRKKQEAQFKSNEMQQRTPTPQTAPHATPHAASNADSEILWENDNTDVMQPGGQLGMSGYSQFPQQNAYSPNSMIGSDGNIAPNGIMPDGGVQGGDMYGNMYGANPYDDTYGYGASAYGYGNAVPGMYSNGTYGGDMYGNGMYGYPGGVYGGYCAPGLVPMLFGNLFCSNFCENLTIGLGGAGFKSPVDQGVNGNFGFTESINWVTPSNFPVSFQAGLRAVQADPAGYGTNGTWQSKTREQYFGTVALFRRNIACSPLNFGVAYDHLEDKYYEKFKLNQLRYELSLNTFFGCDLGYRGSYGLQDDSIFMTRYNRPVNVFTTNYHTVFLRKYYANGGEGTFAGGATNSGDAILRADFSIPLSNTWGLKNSLTYVIPKGGHQPDSFEKETWDVSLQLIYQPRGGILAGFCNPFRAFFDVADNGTLLQGAN